MHTLELIFESYSTIKEESIYGRYITFEKIERLLPINNSEKIGFSELNKPIHKITFGQGSKKILIWSQMHGNESTGTKAIFDLLNLFRTKENDVINKIKNECTITFIPMLNPDGAEAYARENSKKIDLNRDAVSLKAPESKTLRDQLDSIKPLFCFNLHDQRTIFGVEGTHNSAVLSFLAPSTEESRSINKGRTETMNVISAINRKLQIHLPNQIGRYTDEFYPTATGDNFQKLGYNTILVESGHYPNDYKREITRKYTFYSLLIGLYHIASSTNFDDERDYFKIPNIAKNFCDVIHRHSKKQDKAFQFEESIQNGKFTLTPKSLEFTHPFTQEQLTINADFPEDWKTVFEEFQWSSFIES